MNNFVVLKRRSPESARHGAGLVSFELRAVVVRAKRVNA